MSFSHYGTYKNPVSARDAIARAYLPEGVRLLLNQGVTEIFKNSKVSGVKVHASGHWCDGQHIGSGCQSADLKLEPIEFVE